MRKAQKLNYKASKWVISNILDNTILTLIATVIITTAVTSFFDNIVYLFTERTTLVWTGIIFLLIIISLYKFLAYETTIINAKITSKNLSDEWKNNEFRTDIPSIATIDKAEDALYLQFMDIPFTLNTDLPLNYAFEFKAKILNQCFSWCTNASIEGASMRAYMFQYDPIEKKLRPHFLSGFEETKKVTLWVTPELENSPLKSVDNLDLKQKDGWYCIRTEVNESEKTIKLPDLDKEDVEAIIPTYRNSAGEDVEFDRDNINKVIEIQIYDMNNSGKNIYHNFFHEPPFQCFSGGNVGFRNSKFESALYKDIVIKSLK